MKNPRVRETLSVLLCSLLSLSQTVRAQEAGPPTQLNIVIVEGDGAVNNLRQRVVREPIVRVEDQNHKPVAGAAVSFLLPGDGAGGTFVNGGKLLTVTTDANGQAVARGIVANRVAGPYQIHVAASVGKVTATQTIAQSNVAAAATLSTVAIAGIVAAVATVGIVVAKVVTGGKSSPPPPPPQAPTGTIGLGSGPVFGAPH
ncbi:MAG: hypothetical protein ABSG56_28530 [Bryobacteraceae bacterium]